MLSAKALSDETGVSRGEGVAQQRTVTPGVVGPPDAGTSALLRLGIGRGQMPLEKGW